MKVEELHVVREHESACRKLKHRLELGLKRDKVQTRATLCMIRPARWRKHVCSRSICDIRYQLVS